MVEQEISTWQAPGSNSFLNTLRIKKKNRASYLNKVSSPKYIRGSLKNDVRANYENENPRATLLTGCKSKTEEDHQNIKALLFCNVCTH